MNEVIASEVQPSQPAQPMDRLGDFFGSAPASSAANPAEPVETKTEPVPAAETKPEKPAEPSTAAKEPTVKDLQEQLEAKEKQARKTQSLMDRYKFGMEKKMEGLQEEIKVLNAKLNGTYVEPPQPTEQQIRDHASLTAKVQASKAMAYAQHGQELVDAQILNDGSPFRLLEAEQPWLSQRVLRADHPIQEALNVLSEQELFDKYGRSVEAVKKKMEAELRPLIEKDYLDKARQAAPTGRFTTGLREMAHAGGRQQTGSLRQPGQPAFDLDTLTAVQ